MLDVLHAVRADTDAHANWSLTREMTHQHMTHQHMYASTCGMTQHPYHPVCYDTLGLRTSCAATDQHPSQGHVGHATLEQYIRVVPVARHHSLQRQLVQG